MRQHILRLLIVLLLVVGIGFIIYFVVRDNTPFVPTSYISNNIQQDEKLKENLTTLSSSVNSKFTEDVVIYNIYNETSEYYASLLVNITLNKVEASQLKNIYSDYRKKVNTLVASTNSLINYIGLENANENELLGRKEKVNLDFNALNKSYYNVVTSLENLVNSKIYAGKNYSVLGVLKSSLTILTNSYNLTRNNFTLIDNVNNKINAFELNNLRASESAVIYSIKFNELNRQTLIESFNAYFETSALTDDVTILLNFLNSEVYYEEV